MAQKSRSALKSGIVIAATAVALSHSMLRAEQPAPQAPAAQQMVMTPDDVRQEGFRPGYYYFPNVGQKKEDAKYCPTWDSFDKAGRDAAVAAGVIKEYDGKAVAIGVGFLLVGTYYFASRIRKVYKS